MAEGRSLAGAIWKWFVFLIYMVVPMVVGGVCSQLAATLHAYAPHGSPWLFYLAAAAAAVNFVHVAMGALFITFKRELSLFLAWAAACLGVMQLTATVIFGHFIVADKAWDCPRDSYYDGINYTDWSEEVFFRLVASQKFMCALISTFKWWLLFFGVYWCCIFGIHCCSVRILMRSSWEQADAETEDIATTTGPRETRHQAARDDPHSTRAPNTAARMEHRCGNGTLERIYVLENQKNIVAQAMEGRPNTRNDDLYNRPRYNLYPNFGAGAGYASVPTQEPPIAPQVIFANPHSPAPGNLSSV